MYKTLALINHAKSPSHTKKGDIYFIKDELLVSLDNESEMQIAMSNAEKLIAFDNHILVLDDLNRIVKQFDTSNLNASSFPKYDIRIRGLEDTSLLFYQKTKPRNYGFASIDRIDFETTASSIGLLKKDADFIFDIDDTQIRLFNDTDSFKWQYNFVDAKSDSVIEFQKFLGVAFDKVFILSKNGHLIILSVIDGSLIKVLLSKETSLSEDAFMHPENKNIYSLADYFVKFNTQKLKVESSKRIVQEKSDQKPSPVLYGIKDSSLQGEYISFTSFTKERFGFAKWIGLYDYTKEELVWHYELLPSEGQLSIPAFEYPKLAGDKMYVLDTENTLHVFEKENKELA